MSKILFYFICLFFRLIREGLCDRGSAPSISAISRLLRGHDGDDTGSEKKISDGEYFLIFITSYVFHLLPIHIDTCQPFYDSELKYFTIFVNCHTYYQCIVEYKKLITSEI